MITKQHILERAAEWRLRPDVVEKDYILGWLLAGVAQHGELRETWIFKGGTCLKKCYFETYRFSEDLDFSLTAVGVSPNAREPEKRASRKRVQRIKNRKLTPVRDGGPRRPFQSSRLAFRPNRNWTARAH